MIPPAKGGACRGRHARSDRRPGRPAGRWIAGWSVQGPPCAVRPGPARLSSRGRPTGAAAYRRLIGWRPVRGESRAPEGRGQHGDGGPGRQPGQSRHAGAARNSPRTSMRCEGENSPASMKPGLANPGFASSRSAARRMAAASMKPGLANPGFAPGQADHRGSGGASMKPGLANPGFSPPTIPAWTGWPCFNEAGAGQPRILNRPEGWTVRAGASMKPGLANPGFAEAQRGDRPPFAASMKPGLANPGFADRVAVGCLKTVASMKPGLANPGFRARDQERARRAISLQ